MPTHRTDTPGRFPWLRFAAYTAVLYAGLVHNIFCVPEDVFACRGAFRLGHQSGDCTLVVNRLHAADAGPWDSMTQRHGPGSEVTAYRSQFGLHAVALARVVRLTGADPDRVAVIGNLAFGLATAAVLAAFFAGVSAQVGPVAGHVGVAAAACSPALLAFAPAMYWAASLLFAPFVFAWLAYPWARGSNGCFAAFLACVGALVGLKCLCGYEYVTTVILAPVAAVVYHRAAAGDGLRKWVGPAAAVVLVGLAGFAAAMTIHAAQLTALTGQNGFEVIRERAAHRTGLSGGKSGEVVGYPMFVPEWPGVPTPVRCFVNYFCQTAVASPQTWGRVRFEVPLWAVAGVGGAALVVLWRARERSPRAAALAPAAAVGLAASISWQVLAVNHMVLHGHLNLIVFYVPFLLIVFAAVGALVQSVVGANRRAGLAAVVLLLGVVAGNAAVLSGRAASEATDRRDAENRVRAVLRGEETAVGTAGRAFDPGVTTLPFRPPYLPHGGVTVDWHVRPTPPAEPTTGVNGWVLLPRISSGQSPLVVVAVRGNDVIPSDSACYRLTAVERVFRNSVTCAGYQIVVPNEPATGANGLRLFGVPTRPGLPVVELTAGRAD